ncbi:hypothetical protein O6H91_19G043800 [Diphasiastrum complanatum]|uniref:Uncharacterized protein n=1 Tax=Diphasiastrum complanatum TaxID=34168 RepID=A0ACC2AUV8_DIPCM|nr:hypothetical protein O6H91_19G043800 [Diphasiastrum complanatum]
MIFKLNVTLKQCYMHLFIHNLMYLLCCHAAEYQRFRQSFDTKTSSCYLINVIILKVVD